MAEDERGRRGDDDAFEIDDILPELSELDPDLDDLLDLSEDPDPLPPPPPPPRFPRPEASRPTPPPRSEPEHREPPRPLDEPPAPRPEPADHRPSERPSPPEHRRRPRSPARPESGAPPPAPRRQPRREAWDDALEVPDFVRSEPEPTAPSRDEFGPPPGPPEAPPPQPDERVGGPEPEGTTSPRLEPRRRWRESPPDRADELMPPEPEGPAFIDRIVERRDEEREPSGQSTPAESFEDLVEEYGAGDVGEPPPADDVWGAEPDLDPHRGGVAEAEEPAEPPPVEDVEDEEEDEEGTASPTRPDADPLAPHHEPAAVPPPEEAPPRMPGTPVSEIDGFAAQLGDLLGTEGPDAPDGVASAVAPGGDTPGVAEPRRDGPEVSGAPGREASTAPRTPATSTALATRAPTPAETMPGIPPLPTVAFRRAPCAADGRRAAADAADETATHSWAVRAAIVFLALAAAAAVVLTNPRAGDDGEADTTVADSDTEEPADEAGDEPAEEPTGAEPAATPIEPGVTLVAEAAVPLVDVFPEPGAPQADLSLEHPTQVGGPLVFMVEEQRGGWLRVQLPVGGDADAGWVPAEQVTLSRHEYRVEVRLSEHHLRVFQGDETVFQTQIAVGESDAPEPGTSFYIKELLRPPNPDTVYGEFAFGLSGSSNTLEKFNSGEGVVAIHGIDDPSVIGTDVPNGCIGMTNEAIGELVGELPLGTPVELLA